ncbi:MAG: hypothetical protein HY875_04730 [Chloroflexi bacterium]|nr:hypothetical protein [Chloroflexota bacterium]
MTLSSTSPVFAPGSGDDPLYEAWEALRLARQVPWSVEAPAHWRSTFERQVSRARRLLVEHIEQGDGPEIVLARRADASGAFRRQVEEHPALLQQLDDLTRDASAAKPGDIHAVVECSERAAMVEIRLAMHQNRLHELLTQGDGRARAHVARRTPTFAGRS